MALDSVSDYVNEARVLLQDQVAPYRYADTELVSSLNMSLLESRRLRPELFMSLKTIPTFTIADSTPVPMDPQYRVPQLYFIVGHAQMRDDEINQDSRAAVFLNRFTAQMMSLV